MASKLRMRAGLRKRWVEALRSGEYEQGKGQLRTQAGTYCCLGVLCDILVKDGLITDEQAFYTADGYHAAAVPQLPALAVIFPGISKPKSTAESDIDWAIGGSEELVVLNDMRGASFGDIAKLIETGKGIR